MVVPAQKTRLGNDRGFFGSRHIGRCLHQLQCVVGAGDAVVHGLPFAPEVHQVGRVLECFDDRDFGLVAGVAAFVGIVGSHRAIHPVVGGAVPVGEARTHVDAIHERIRPGQHEIDPRLVAER